ncbi:MAG: sigma-E processing peptidase SpoIIGA, partial [Oscillospiraceae bacterium]|nr:sigma-E processing peptidase SpoIIGA [Oscillospiraceae bacterium]
MVKTIYADILFLINFIINYLILFTTGHICAHHIRRLRLFLASSAGALYGIAVFFPAFPFITSVPVKLVFSTIMVIISFGKCNILKNTLVFLGISLAFGGAVFAATLLGFGNFCEVRGGVYYIHLSVSA